MKKIIYSAMAVAMLATTSCKDDFAESFVGEEATVEFNISTPEIATRAFSEGDEIKHLHYAIYDGEDLLDNLGLSTEFEKAGDSSVNLSLTLKTGKTYKAIFWADAVDAPYDVVFTDGGATMTMKDQTIYSNDESLDAFYEVVDITITGNQQVPVYLKRPFAQINFGTNDIETAAAVGFDVDQTAMEVSVYTQMDLFNNSVVADSQTTKRFEYAAIPQGEQFPVDNYDYLAMNYVLVGEKQTADVTFYYTDTTGDEMSKHVGAVPMQRNYRTNIYGSVLTSTANVLVQVVPDFGGNENKQIVQVATLADLQAAIANPNVGQVVLTDDIDMSDNILVIGAPSNNPAPTRSGAVAASRNIVIDGNGKTLRSNAARAINVSGVDGVTIKNLTIEASGERAINVINNATNVTVEGVTATAANYTVNLAASAANAVVAIKASNLTGLNVVNVAAAGAKVTVDGTTLVCNDQNANESYAAIAVNNESKNATVVVTNSKFDIKGDSAEVSNGAEGATITIDGVEYNEKIVAVIEYEGTDNYYSFETLEAAIEFAKDGETITLIRDITMNAKLSSGYGKAGIVVDNGITIDGNGKKLTVNGAWDTWDCAIAAKNGTIKNLTVSSAFRGIFMPGATGDVIIDNVIFDNVIYTFNSDAGDKNYGVYISNSTLNGWTSHSDVHKEVVYTKCSFGEGNGNAFCRPYGKTSFVNCTFCPGYEVDRSQTTEITFTDCTWE